jgi:hypothetical protein
VRLEVWSASRSFKKFSYQNIKFLKKNNLGAAAQGFSLQYIVGPIARQAAVPENNVRNCGYSYIISATIYILCGGLGLFGISGR